MDTFEEEEPVDLAEVSSNIRSIEKKLSKVDKSIGDFCSELGIETPF